MRIKELTSFLEEYAPSMYQEDYDNSGLIVGVPDTDITGVLVTLDVTEDVIQEAIEKGCNLIVSHHPIVFRGLKKLNGKNYVERAVILAIKNDIAIYAIHTNLDNVLQGVNQKIAQKIGLKNLQILKPLRNTLYKLTVFVPASGNYTEELLDALHQAGAGEIGNYSSCSFQNTGTGSFTPNVKANPMIGQSGLAEKVVENRVEVLVPAPVKPNVLKAMYASHPYEEVSYYLSKLENTNQDIGAGIIGDLAEEITEGEFLAHLKDRMNLKVIRYTSCKKQIKRIAICGGSGSFLLQDAKHANADAFVTADFKYHEFFDSESQILIADIGHFESEVFTKDLLVEIISKKITNFATYLSEVNTNPVSYYY